MEKLLNEKWTEYYNSFQYSFYIFGEKFIFVDIVEEDVQHIVEYDNRIYKKMISIEQNNLRKDTSRRPETLSKLIKIFNNVDKTRIYSFNYYFGDDE